MANQEEYKFKNIYIAIFASNYFFQGVTGSVFGIIIPIYLISFIRTISASEIALISSIIGIPWVFKVIYGIISDKYKIKNFGRRKPYILFFMSLAGIVWIMLSIPNIVTPNNALLIFTIAGVLINLGVAVADTALDGFIIDISPKDKLGRTQGFCWGLNSVGGIIGGPLLAYLLFYIHTISVQLIFVVVGIFMITTSLFILIIKEKEEIYKVKIGKQLKNMFNNKRDWLAYFYSMLRAIIDGVIFFLISITILIKIGVIEANGATLSIASMDRRIFLYLANISIIIAIGIILGSIIGGHVADVKTRKAGVILSIILTTFSTLLFVIDFSFVPLLLFIACLSGLALGWRRSVAVAIQGEISKNHPEMDSTNFSISMAFANIGVTLGLLITAILLNLTQDFSITFFYLALMSLLVILPLVLMDPKDYEYKLEEND